MRGVVLDGQGGAHLDSAHCGAQSGHRRVGQGDQPIGHDRLEPGVVGAAVALGGALPRLEGPGVGEGEDLRGGAPLPRLDGGEGAERRARHARQEVGRGPLDVVVVGGRAHPHVGAVDAVGQFGQLQVDADGGEPGADLVDGAAHAAGGRADGAVGGQEAVVGGARPRAGDDHGRPVDGFAGTGAGAVDDAHADRAPVLDEDLADLLAHPDPAAAGLDAVLDGARDAGAAPFGEPRALQVVGDYRRVRYEGAARGLDAVVAPLGGQEDAEPGVAEAALQVGLRGVQGRAAARPLGEADEGLDGSRHHLPRVGQRPPRRGRPDIAEVAAHGPRLVGESGDEGVLVRPAPGGDAEVDAGVDEAVVVAGHRPPMDLPAGEVVEGPAEHLALAEAAQVVDPHVPGGPAAPEGVGEPSGDGVLLQDEDPLARRPGQESRC